MFFFSDLSFCDQSYFLHVIVLHDSIHALSILPVLHRLAGEARAYPRSTRQGTLWTECQPFAGRNRTPIHTLQMCMCFLNSQSFGKETEVMSEVTLKLW